MFVSHYKRSRGGSAKWGGLDSILCSPLSQIFQKKLLVVCVLCYYFDMSDSVSRIMCVPVVCLVSELRRIDGEIAVLRASRRSLVLPARVTDGIARLLCDRPGLCVSDICEILSDRVGSRSKNVHGVIRGALSGMVFSGAVKCSGGLYFLVLGSDYVPANGFYFS